VTKRKRWMLVVGVPASIAILAALACLLWPRSAINRGNFEKIKEGMTLAEVQALLGGPPRDETTGPVMAEIARADTGPWSREALGVLLADDFHYRPTLSGEGFWASNSLMVRVFFDQKGRVTSCESVDVVPIQESPITRLRRWLRL
jgi:hypothetical protein